MTQTPDAPADDTPGLAHPELWPATRSIGLIDPETERFVTEVMARMSLREKVGQMIQGDIESIRPEDLRDYPVGSVLAGGNSPPLGGDDRAPIEAWIRTTQAFRNVALEQRPGHEPVPIIFGIDAVHGNSNVPGAVLFPHNVGLGAMRDPALIERIGAATAAETAAAGAEWAFSPAVSVPQDDRWGRTYEGYAERPEVARDYAAAMVRGLQGEPGLGRVQDGKVAGSLKHFMADGGTADGIDQGDAKIPERTLIDLHAQGYISGISAGAMTVMVSFSSWNGVKMHANKSLLTDVLKGRLGFAGFVVGDWNAHSQVPGCSGEDCPAVFNAGLDMAMAPHSWKGLFENTLKEAENGTIPLARIDDAVHRILRVKAKLGLFNPERPYVGRPLLAVPEHREIGREAVARSLVLLKNNGGLLPIRPRARVLVTGSHADDIGLQSGGWTLSWQGTGNTNANFPNATSIWSGLKSAIEASGGTAVLARDGAFAGPKPDLAVVVFGEQPYAETTGDIQTLAFAAQDPQPLRILKALRAQHIPTISVFLSGRPLWVNPELNASDAFVAAFLPGSEGGGVADVLVAKADGAPNRDFSGRLSYSWPKRPDQFANNFGQPGYDPLFAYGYGLGYGDRTTVPELDESPGNATAPLNIATYFTPGKVLAPWKLDADGAVTMKPVDSDSQQEAARQYAFAGPGRVRVTGPAIDLSRSAGRLALRLDYRLDALPAGRVTVAMGETGKPVDVTEIIASRGVGQWTSLKVPLACFQGDGTDLTQVSAPFVLESDAALTLSVVGIQLDANPAGNCQPILAAR